MMEEVYAIVYFDAVRVKIHDDGLVRNKAVYLAIGVTCRGRKEVLGLWIEQTEDAKFWLSVMNELKARGVADVLIAVVGGPKGFLDAIEAVFPQATVQTCIVGLLEESPDGRTKGFQAECGARHAWESGTLAGGSLHCWLVA